MNPAALNSVTSDASLVSALLSMFGGNRAKQISILKGCQNIDLKRALKPQTRIGLYDQLCIIGNATEVLGDNWALKAPQFWDKALENVFCSAIYTAPTLDDAFDILARYGYLWSPALYFEAFPSPKGKTICNDVIAVEELHGSATLGLAVLKDLSLIGIYQLFDRVLKGRWAGCKILWSDTNKQSKIHHAFFSAPTEISPVRTGIQFPTKLCTRPNPLADPAKFRKAKLQLQNLINPADEERALEAIVLAYVDATQYHRPTIGEVAKSLGMSTRTLNRRLEDSGVSFRQLLEQSLQNRTKNLLKQGRLSRGEIAERLGYKDQASFSRALKRWSQA